VLSGESCDESLATRLLRGESCEESMERRVLRRESCEESLERRVLRREYCEETIERRLFDKRARRHYREEPVQTRLRHFPLKILHPQNPPNPETEIPLFPSFFPPFFFCFCTARNRKIRVSGFDGFRGGSHFQWKV